MNGVVDTAVIPLAGLATRIQPLARAFPKEMLPLGDRPVLHHVIEELASAGVRHVVLVLGARAETVRRYFDRIPELDKRLEERGHGRTRDPMWVSLADVRLTFVVQEKPRGVADAVSRARDVIGDRPYLVHMGDSVVWPASGVIRRMIEAFAETDADMTVAVGWSLVHGTGANAVAEPIDGEVPADRPFRVRRFLENPPADGPALPFVVGRFLMKGPLVPWQGGPSGFGRLGGLAPLCRDPDAARVVAVPFAPQEQLLGSGTLAEYHASWRHILGGGET
jgi:UTP--glucose-1-phosphate uridylyltransferase